MSEAIERRYSVLADTDTRLSCGTSVDHGDVRPGQVCVDLGCGRGADVLRLAEQVGPLGQAVGVDLTEAMLERARHTAATLGVRNVTFLRSRLERLALPGDYAHWVFSNCALNHAADKPAVWRELARVLKEGGRFVVSDIYAVEAIPEQYRNDPAAVAECWAGAVTREAYLADVAAAGLTEVKVLKESRPYARGAALVASFTLTGLKGQVS